MAQCTFCGTEIPRGKGTMFIKKDAKVLWFCSSKCEKNTLKLNRKPRYQPWTAEAKHNKDSARQTTEHKAETAAAEEKKRVRNKKPKAEKHEEGE